MQKCAGVSEEIFCHIINIHCLPISLYGLESFNISFVQKCRTAVAYNTIIKRIFNFGRFVWIRNLLAFIGSKPADIIVDERHMNVGFYCLVCCIIAHIIITVNSSMFTNVSFKYDEHVTYTVYIFYFILAYTNLMVTIGIINI